MQKYSFHWQINQGHIFPFQDHTNNRHNIILIFDWFLQCKDNFIKRRTNYLRSLHKMLTIGSPLTLFSMEEYMTYWFFVLMVKNSK